MNSLDIRNAFLSFFKNQGHTIVPSSSLIPAEDPTLLFTNAGMNQFKDLFLGLDARSYKRAASIQKCIRAGGKHNDLEQVGYTARHLTFFEMMGNFSFGDYFKKDAIAFAWDFLTNTIKLDPKTLWASVHYTDEESYALWLEISTLPASRIVRLGDEDNFWSMGAVGPCGPCTEIYVDRGISFGCKSQHCQPGCSCDRFIEIWNLVFMQYNRDESGVNHPLEQTGVDTGMGLERLCMIMQKVPTVYDTDIFQSIFHALTSRSHIDYADATEMQKTAFRVVADHARSVSLALADGGTPAADGRGYVIRKIIRRAALFAQELGDQRLFADACRQVIAGMAAIYPDLQKNSATIIHTVSQELEKFEQQLQAGQLRFAQEIKQLGAMKNIPGSVAFKLYDTYGFPLELTLVMAQRQGYTVDKEGFEAAMELQRQQSGKKKAVYQLSQPIDLTTEFVGYKKLRIDTEITGLFIDGVSVDRVPANTRVMIITKHSPIYIECGGQVTDKATVHAHDAVISVEHATKMSRAIGMTIMTPVPLAIADDITIVVDRPTREATMKNHTATHLLHAALRKLISPAIKQAGSLVNAECLRFDITYDKSLTVEEINSIEMAINHSIMQNWPVSITETTYQNAINQGVTAFFGDKYNPESVRVVSVIDESHELPSAELCGGTHVARTGDIGFFKITEQSALAAGVKRLTAVTGPAAVRLVQELFTQNQLIARTLSVAPHATATSVEQLQKEFQRLQKQYKQLHAKNVLEQAIDKIKEHTGTETIIELQLSDASLTDARETIPSLLSHIPTSIDAILLRTSLTVSEPETVLVYIVNNRISNEQMSEIIRKHGFKGGGSRGLYQIQLLHKNDIQLLHNELVTR